MESGLCPRKPLQSRHSGSRSVRQGAGMNESGSVIARRLAFLERELDRMGGGG